MKKINPCVVGLMSGTSLDGVDLIAVVFKGEEYKSFDIVAAETISYDDEWKTKLSRMHDLSAYEFLKLHKEYGLYLGKLVNDFIKKYLLKVDLISSHGHTIFHEPHNRFNFQVGDGSFIAATTGITTVCDFRTLDIAMGGQGAPLVPLGDDWLFSDYTYCLNIGGFANVSFKQENKRIAFDICPANFVLNYLSNKLGYPYDPQGKLASQGNVISELLDKLNLLPYYQQKYPKSLGREWVENNIFPLLSDKYRVNDLLATICEHIAIQIGKSCTLSGTMLVTGGGSYNEYLIFRMQNYLTPKIVIPDKIIIEYKEALIFALLGLLRVQRKVNILSSVTGAPEDLIGGVVHWIN